MPSSVTQQAALLEPLSGESTQPLPPETNEPRTLCWRNILWVSVLHLGLLAAPWTFTWQGLMLMIGLHWLTGAVGISLGYHRLFTHRSFMTYRPIRCFIAWLGTLAGEGEVVHWVANHRKHHVLSDREGDPHSPIDGPFWSHMWWLMYGMPPKVYREHNQRWAPDLLKDPVLRFLGRTFIWWQVALAAALFAIGYWAGGSRLAWSFLVWGIFVRLVAVLHTTWFVNSASHMWGYRNYPTRDNSRNLWWVALLTYGEGWHNNHHAQPRSARFGHRWWEVDLTYQCIRFCSKLGLFWNVIEPRTAKMDKAVPTN